MHLLALTSLQLDQQDQPLANQLWKAQQLLGCSYSSVALASKYRYSLALCAAPLFFNLPLVPNWSTGLKQNFTASGTHILKAQAKTSQPLLA
jgi:hypothetical protein